MQKLARLGSAFVVAATLASFSGTMPAKADANAPFCLQPQRMRLLYPRAMYGGRRRHRWFMHRESPSRTSQMSKIPVRGASTI